MPDAVTSRTRLRLRVRCHTRKRLANKRTPACTARFVKEAAADPSRGGPNRLSPWEQYAQVLLSARCGANRAFLRHPPSKSYRKSDVRLNFSDRDCRAILTSGADGGWRDEQTGGQAARVPGSWHPSPAKSADHSDRGVATPMRRLCVGAASEGRLCWLCLEPAQPNKCTSPQCIPRGEVSATAPH